ncbi:MAG: ribonuclease R [Deltaproteobacteria bacterium]|jgi:ribonuclease R|nr:ribonuclease R [Deltaproteobacteria bacterium]
MRRRQKGFRKSKFKINNSSRKRYPQPAGAGKKGGISHTALLAQEVLAHLYQHKEPQNITEIMAGLSLIRSERKMLSSLLADMCRQHMISCPQSRKAGKLYSLAQKDDLVEGVVEVNPKGFGFAIIAAGPEAPTQQKDRSLRQDPFIAPDNLGSAHQGDRALFRLIPKRRGRTEAIVIKVLHRAATILVGGYEAGRQTSLVIPEDERFLFNVLVRRKDSCGARNGDAVVVEITDFKGGHRNPEGRIIEVLGDPENIGVQAEIVIRKHKLPHKFSERALQEADSYPDSIPDDKARLDLRAVPHMTIDGETARDFDDAVAVEKIAGGWRLYVSIADVSYYVKPGSALDREAYERGTSVYFPNRVVPMLPERLANNLCSLVPRVARPAFTAIIEFDRQGKRLTKKFAKSIIVSRHRLTYTIVKQILVDRDKLLAAKYDDIFTQLQEMAQLAAVLEKKRFERGSIGFSIPEAEVLMNDENQITDVIRAERNMAHKLIEEFMLAANEAVAAQLSDSNIPTLYRIHESPDDMKVREFTKFARTLGLHLSANGGSPKWFGKVLAKVDGTPKEYIVNNILLRTMQRARYSPENVGHFGLAATYYTHFTSPIRRYPDLLVHRNLMGMLMKKKGSGVFPAQDLKRAGDFLSDRERTAVNAEREMTERLQVRFMEEKIGESFDGIVSGVTGFGLFIELLDHFVSGAIEITKLKGDYYHFDEKNYRLVGTHTNKVYQVGDLVRIKVASVDIRQRRINFVIE